MQMGSDATSASCVLCIFFFAPLQRRDQARQSLSCMARCFKSFYTAACSAMAMRFLGSAAMPCTKCLRMNKKSTADIALGTDAAVMGSVMSSSAVRRVMADTLSFAKDAHRDDSSQPAI
jgi:hypothetical protein